MRVAAAVRRGPGEYPPAAGAWFEARSMQHAGSSVGVVADAYPRWVQSKPFSNLVHSRLHHVLRVRGGV